MNQAQTLARATWLERQAEAFNCKAARAALEGWARDLRKFAGSVEPVPHADRDWSEERVSNGA